MDEQEKLKQMLEELQEIKKRSMERLEALADNQERKDFLRAFKINEGLEKL